MADRVIRASDRDRDRAIELLREQTADGRLTIDEFEQRMGSAHTAKTWDELRDLVSDLPVELPFGEETGRIDDVAGRPSRHPARWITDRPARLLLPLIIAGGIAGTAVGVGQDNGFPWILFALFWVFCGGGCGARARRAHYPRSRT